MGAFFNFKIKKKPLCLRQKGLIAPVRRPRRDLNPGRSIDNAS